jgi:hypothetical protein
MAKKQKTLRQKMRSDQRQHPTKAKEIAPLESQAHSVLAPQLHIPSTQNNKIIVNEYSYLSKDLIKTLLLTASIVIAELILRTYTNLA